MLSINFRTEPYDKANARAATGWAVILFVIGVCRENYFGVVYLPLTIVTFFVSLIWIGQPIGYTAITMADVFASIFSVAYFATFALAMVSRVRTTADQCSLLALNGYSNPACVCPLLDQRRSTSI